MDCLFCSIVKGEIPSKKVYEDDMVYAFRDIHPKRNDTWVVPPRFKCNFLPFLPGSGERRQPCQSRWTGLVS